ncbi:MAG: hypothetical protein MR832_03945 [Clostridiales bacterium]|nr:hypothetical protein [Clostridiales bacterium]
MNKDFIFETEQMRYCIARNGLVTAVIDKRTGKNHLKQKDFFAKLYREHSYLERDIHADPGRNYLYIVGPQVPTGAVPELPEGAEYAGGVLTVRFARGFVRFKVDEQADFISFEVLDEIPEGYYSMTFAETALDLDIEDENAFCAVGYAMNVKFKPHFYPSPAEQAIRGEVFACIGCRGAKLAVLSSRIGALRDAMKRVNAFIDPRQMTLNLAGGAYAADYEENFGTYSIVHDIEDPEHMEPICEKFHRYGVRQVDFHQGTAFIQGDFHFLEDKYGGSAKEFRKRVTEPLSKAGFASGLHTYAHYISVKSLKYTSDPWAQKQLFRTETRTLAADMNEYATFLPTEEDSSDVSLITGFRVKNSLYLLVDEEIMRYSAVSKEGLTVERGVCGTRITAHKAGTEIAHLGTMFGYFMPVLGSELFYEIARNTARTFNEGGFQMIYLDALDGLSMFEPKLGWYYTAQFVLEMLRYVERPPLLEYSTLYPLLWYSRSRIGAWDNATNGYKRFINEHIQFNTEGVHAFGLPYQLGWYCLYPLMQYTDDNPGSQVKIMFRDDVDMAGARALGYNHGMSYNPLTDEALASSPGFARNIERYAEYEKLRVSKYFSEEALKRLRTREEEFTLLKEESYWMAPAHYDYAKVYADDEKRSGLRGVNPFAGQKPMLRIECLYTCGSGEGVELPAAGESVFDPLLDLSGKTALRVRARGNNSDDSMLIELRNPFHLNGHTAYFEVPLNYEGEREFLLAENDCGEFPADKYEGYEFMICSECMGSLRFSSIESMRIMKHGSCEGAELLTIEAVPCGKASVTNPSIHFRSQTITFLCMLNSGEYLEYRDGQARIFDWRGAERSVDGVVEDGFELPSGEYALQYSDSDHDKDARVRLTAGFTGERFR